MGMRLEGVIREWNDARGFGFIAPAHGGPDVFVHIHAIQPSHQRPSAQQAVTYVVTMGPNGQARAKDVELVRPAGAATARKPVRAAQATARAHRTAAAPPDGQPIPPQRSNWIAGLIGAGVVAACHYLGQPPRGALWLYPALSLVTFFAYALDKSAARQGAWRTKEDTLHMLALAGGWPGALLAQTLLRHKTRKASFRRMFWATVVFNLAGYAFLSSPYAAALRAALGW